MNDQNVTNRQAQEEGKATPLSLGRRAMMLKSLGRGSSVVAAASLPVHVLAQTPTIVIKGTNTRCSISGMQSGMGSRVPAVSQTCTGKSPGYWHNPDNWTPAQIAVIRASSRPTFNSFFGSPTTTNGHNTLEAYLRTTGEKYRGQVKGLNNTDDWHWICAWMNAMANGSGGVQNFPYTAPEIVEMYRDPGRFVQGKEPIDVKRKYALDFLKLIEGTAG